MPDVQEIVNGLEPVSSRAVSAALNADWRRSSDKYVRQADAVAAVHAAVDAATRAKLCDCNDPDGCVVVERRGGLPCACRVDDDGTLVIECLRHKEALAAAADARTQETLRIVAATINEWPGDSLGMQHHADSLIADIEAAVARRFPNGGTP